VTRIPITVSHRNTALRILRYLAEHPDARDSVSGIIEWWLMEQRIREERAKIVKTLEELVAQDVLLEHRHKNAEEQFSINPEKRELIRNLLK
jgi:hypothetical protein